MADHLGVDCSPGCRSRAGLRTVSGRRTIAYRDGMGVYLTVLGARSVSRFWLDRLAALEAIFLFALPLVFTCTSFYRLLSVGIAAAVALQISVSDVNVVNLVKVPPPCLQTQAANFFVRGGIMFTTFTMVTLLRISSPHFSYFLQTPELCPLLYSG